MKKSAKKHKKAISMPFEWIFAMLIGGIIIFIAVYAAVKGFEGGIRDINTRVIARLESYLSPYETGLGSGQTGEIHFSASSTMYFDQCDENDYNSRPFGSQTISFTQKMFRQNQKQGEYIPLVSKYVFANETIEGKDFYIASLPFFMGYKVSDLILIYSNKYCFVQAPNEIKEQVDDLQLKNIIFSDEIDNCTGIKVCFDFDNKACKIKVYPNDDGNYESGRVEAYSKKKELYEVHYMGNLLYGAIFSYENLYECNVKRLMNKFRELGNVYLEKIKIIEIKGCSSNIAGKLASVMQGADELESSRALLELSSEIEDIQKINDAAQEGCRLFSGE